MAHFTDEEAVAIRRHAGYPAQAGAAADGLSARLSALSVAEGAVIIGRYLPILTDLEQDVSDVRGNLDTAKAAVWERNASELLERAALYRFQRLALCRFLGIDAGPALFDVMVVDPCKCSTTGSNTPGGGGGGIVGPSLPPAVLVV